MKAVKFILFFLFITFLLSSYFATYTPLIIPLAYLFLSILSVVLYTKDKQASLKNNWRVSENTLQLCSLFGGWPGAIMAQEILRHKTRKTSFQLKFWLVTVINISAIIWLHTSEGSGILFSTIKELEHRVLTGIDAGKVRNALLYVLQYS